MLLPVKEVNWKGRCRIIKENIYKQSFGTTEAKALLLFTFYSLLLRVTFHISLLIPKVSDFQWEETHSGTFTNPTAFSIAVTYLAAFFFFILDFC